MRSNTSLFNEWIVQKYMLENKPVETDIRKHSGNKYVRTIYSVLDEKPIHVDVYSVLDAFRCTCPGVQHALKKLLCAGLRDKGSVLQDLKEARDAVTRAIQMEEKRTNVDNAQDVSSRSDSITLGGN